MLAHPTMFVTEEQLRENYAYVMADLRKMALLSAALMYFWSFGPIHLMT